MLPPTHNQAKLGNIIWIDIAKFIGIFLVIFHHSTPYCEEYKSILYYTQAFINLFHIPLFFILSGYLYKDKGLKNNFSKILYSLLIPYIIYQLFYFPFKYGYLVSFKHLDMIIALKRLVIGFILGDVVGNNSVFSSVCLPLWFLIVMIQLRILFAFVKTKITNIIITAIVALIFLKILLYYKIDLYFCLDNTLLAIPYFVAGMLFHKYKDCFAPKFDNFKNKKLIYVFTTVLCFLITLLILKINWYFPYAEFISKFKGNRSLLLVYSSGILGTAGVCFFSNLFKSENDFVKTIAKNTLFIMYFHFQLLFIFRSFGIKHLIFKYLYEINPILINGKYHLTTVQSFILCTLYTFVNLFICYFIIKYLEKRHPIILGKGKKQI